MDEHPVLANTGIIAGVARFDGRYILYARNSTGGNIKVGIVRRLSVSKHSNGNGNNSRILHFGRYVKKIGRMSVYLVE